MLKTTSQEFRNFFLLEFTKELINNFSPKEIIKLELIENQEKQQKEKEIRQHIQQKYRPPSNSVQIPVIFPSVANKKKYFMEKSLVAELRTPPLPLGLQYLKPIPKETSINLGKLNFFIKDPSVISIECDGEGKNIIVNAPSQKNTDIFLTKEEIDQIIQEFSENSKIPIEEGIIKIAAGKLILLAIVSKIVSTKFIIRKINSPRMF